MIKKTLQEESKLVDFLWESNKIEDVTDDDSFFQALKAWRYLNKRDKLSVEILNKTHGILSKKSELQEDQKGQFRKVPVWIGGREGKPWHALPELMMQWVINANDLIENQIKKDSSFTLERIIQEQHITFETIHPYVDFNGRCGRLILNWTRIRCHLPILVLRSDERQKYYKWFT